MLFLKYGGGSNLMGLRGRNDSHFNIKHRLGSMKLLCQDFFHGVCSIHSHLSYIHFISKLLITEILYFPFQSLAAHLHPVLCLGRLTFKDYIKFFAHFLLIGLVNGKTPAIDRVSKRMRSWYLFPSLLPIGSHWMSASFTKGYSSYQVGDSIC